MTEIVQRMISTMAHRGPDADGIWTDPQGRCVLGHRRLSIIDTSDAGRQPMATGDGRWLITFNGELYNFQELRPALQRAGVTLRGRTDTEVLIESLALWGADVFPKLDGMFAFGAFDTLTGTFWLARDAFGEKPLYYMELNGGGLAFASELQALEGVPGFDGTVNVDAMAEVLSFQYIGAPRSIYRSVKKLLPGHWLRIGADGRIETGRYFHFQPGINGFTDRPMPELVDELEDILVRSLRGRLIADVPLGAFLSGGVDSSVACALIRRKLDRPIMTFSTGFQGAPESEHHTARLFAQHLGTDHHEEVLSPDAAEFLFDAGRILDEPNADSSCLPTYLLSRFARQHVTVAISGDGGDEMFGGYGRYFATLDELQRHRAGSLPEWHPGPAYYSNRILVSVEPHIRELFGFIPAGFGAHLGQLRGELDRAPELLCEMRRSDVDNYMPGAVLPKVDRMSMRHSLEVRTPYLSVELARFAERLPDSVQVENWRGKLLLRQLAYRYLPRELIDLPKQGFGLPMSDWARTSLLDVTARLVESDDSRLRSALGSKAIGRFMTRQRTPGTFAAYQVWAVAMLESWLRHHPASIPSIAEERRGSTGSSEPKGDPLDVVEIGPAIYLAGKGVADIENPPDIAGIHQTIMALSLRDAAPDMAALNRNFGSLDADRPSLALPDWGTSLTADDLARLAPLRGSTLAFYELDASQNFDYAEIRKFRQLGVARIFFRSPFVEREFREIDIRYGSRPERVANLLKLYRKRIARLSGKAWMKLFGSYRFTSTSDGDQQSDLIRKIVPFPDTELVASYMMFEGLRQLPPVQVAQPDIGTRGNGRHSIWNQVVFFSPTEPERLHTRPYWIVPNTAETEPYLPLVPRVFRKLRSNPEVLERLLNELLDAMAAREGNRPFRLDPGDPVVVCTHGLPPGGAERQWIYLAQALFEAGYRVTFVTYEALDAANSHYLPILQASGIPHIDVSKMSITEAGRRWPDAPGASALLGSNIVPEADRLVRLTAGFVQAAPKVVFAQLDHPNILAGLAAHFAGVPRVVMSFRNYNPTHFPYLLNDWFLPAYRLLVKSDRVLLSGNHKDANDDYAKWIGIPQERVTHIPNAIEPEMFPMPSDEEIAAARAGLGVDADTLVILGVFRLSREKDPFTFLEVCARAAKSYPKLRAFIVGVGPMKPQIETRIEQLGLELHVTLLGRRSDVNTLMRLSSVFLLTSEQEGMPNVLMEAQLMATPIVATRAGGTSDTVRDGETAILADVGDVDGLAKACIKLLGDERLRHRMGAAGYCHVSASFQKAALGQRYVDLARGQLARDEDAQSSPVTEQIRLPEPAMG